VEQFSTWNVELLVFGGEGDLPLLRGWRNLFGEKRGKGVGGSRKTTTVSTGLKGEGAGQSDGHWPNAKGDHPGSNRGRPGKEHPGKRGF